jgi:hypothetical protein
MTGNWNCFPSSRIVRGSEDTIYTYRRHEDIEVSGIIYFTLREVASIGSDSVIWEVLYIAKMSSCHFPITFHCELERHSTRKCFGRNVHCDFGRVSFGGFTLRSYRG